MVDDLKNKVVLVIGSSWGIGEGTVVLFASYGCKVVVHGRNEERIARVAAKCEQVSPFGYKPLTVAADLENLEEIRKIVSQTIDHYNQIDVFVCNIAMKDKLYEILDENILKCFEAAYSRRIRAATYLAHLVLPYLIETKGNMIIVSSAASSIPLTGGTLTLIPHMCDASFDMLSKTLACEFGSKGVRVNTVNPNVVNTESNYTLLPDPKQVKAILEKAVQKTALKKLIEPEDVAKCIVFLASNAASFITGHSLVVDGGFLYK
ncbi:putative oxidoreductase-like protein [Dinothrombium tinctorium]|uniref:Putative oxidoreductase-like protein n=1 Tax=Dinothrombium tinctorium TaxID=1965070 RepID=A0A3S3PDM6_9ACAR|nr:putative oxidoreductase-like protein [Dinothrombium tinctorium]